MKALALLSDEEVAIRPNCGEVVSFFQGGD